MNIKFCQHQLLRGHKFDFWQNMHIGTELHWKVSMRDISCKKNPKSTLSEELCVIAVLIYDKEPENILPLFCFSLKYV